MKRSVLIGIGSLALALTASAQTAYNQPQKKALQTTTTNRAYRSAGGARQAAPQRTFSSPRFRQPSFSTARSRESTSRTARIQPRTNTSFMDRPAMGSAALPRTIRPAINNYSAGSRLSPRPRATSAFVNRQSEISDALARRQTHLAAGNDLREFRLEERPRSTSAFTSRSDVGDIAVRRQARPAS